MQYIPEKKPKPVCAGINMQYWGNLKEPCGETFINIFKFDYLTSFIVSSVRKKVDLALSISLCYTEDAILLF